MNIGFFLVFVKDILMKLNDPTLGVNSSPTPRSVVDAGMFILEELFPGNCWLARRSQEGTQSSDHLHLFFLPNQPNVCVNKVDWSHLL